MSDKKREEIPEPTPRIMVTIDIWLEKTFVPLTGPRKGAHRSLVTRCCTSLDYHHGRASHLGPHLEGDSVITWQEHGVSPHPKNPPQDDGYNWHLTRENFCTFDRALKGAHRSRCGAHHSTSITGRRRKGRSLWSSFEGGFCNHLTRAHMCHPTHQISHAKQFYTSPGTPWNLYPAVPIASARFPLAERNVKKQTPS